MIDPAVQTTVRISNFRNLEDIRIAIRPLTLLFGPNGSGKSSLLLALKFLRANILPLNKGVTKYRLSDTIDLGSFKETVTANDVSKRFSIEIELSVDEKDSTSWKQARLQRVEFIQEQLTERDLGSFVRYQTNLVDNGHDFCVEMQHTKERGGVKARPIPLYDNDGPLKASVSLEFAQNKFQRDLRCLEILNHLDGRSIRITRQEIDKDLPQDYRRTASYPWKVELISSGGADPIILFGSCFLGLNELPFTSYEKDPSTYRQSRGERVRSIESRIQGYIFQTLQGKNSIWEDLSASEKSELYNTVIKCYDLFYVLFPSMIASFLDGPDIPPVRESPRHRYFLQDDHFSADAYYGLLKDLDKSKQKLVNDFTYVAKRSETTDLVPTILEEIENLAPEVGSYDRNVLANVCQMLKKLGLALAIDIVKENAVGSMQVFSLDGAKFNFAESSSGLIQIFPLIVQLSTEFDSDPDDVLESLLEVAVHQLLIVEQPELHLHPKLQSELAGILGNARNKIILVETHSEHIVRKIQVLVADGEITPSKLGIYYFGLKNGRTQIRNMQIDNNGFFKDKWPTGFFDCSSDLVLELWKPRKRAE